jgi:hypothetical protein
MFTHRLVGSFYACDSLVANIACHFPAAFQRGGETFAGFPDFFSGYVYGGGHQGTRIFSKRAQVITGCMFMFVHIVLFFLFLFC